MNAKACRLAWPSTIIYVKDKHVLLKVMKGFDLCLWLAAKVPTSSINWGCPAKKSMRALRILAQPGCEQRVQNIYHHHVLCLCPFVLFCLVAVSKRPGL